MKRILPIAAVLATFLYSAPAHAQERGDGNKLLAGCSAALKVFDDPSAGSQVDARAAWYCIGYVEGIRDGLDASRLLASSSHVEDAVGIAFPDGVTNGQLVRVLVKWLQDHPLRLHEDMLILSLRAFHDAFPAAKLDASSGKAKQ